MPEKIRSTQKANEQKNNGKYCSDVILEKFHQWGVETIFFVPGAQVDFFLSRAAQDNRFNLVMAAHELGAGYMADGFSRISGRPSAAVGINGPGALNFATAAATAKVDHSRVIFLTGDAPTFLDGYEAFQSSEYGGISTKKVFESVLHYSFKIDTIDSMNEAMSFFEATLKSDLHCPVHFDLPADFAKKIMPPHISFIKKYPHVYSIPETGPCLPQDLLRTPGIKTAILVGEELKNYEDMISIAEFSRKFSIPTAVTMGAKNLQSVIADELFLGVFGYAGCERSFKAIMDPELETLIIFGASLDERNTAGWHKNFFSHKRNIFHFSLEMPCQKIPHTNVKSFHVSSADAVKTLDRLWSGDRDKEFSDANIYYKRSAWCKNLIETDLHPKIDNDFSKSNSNKIEISSAICSLNSITKNDSVLFLDSGDHRIYGSTFWKTKNFRSFFTAAKTAPLGWAICAAVGASFSNASNQIIVLTGDACMLMHGIEIAVASRYKKKILFLVSANGAHGRIAARMKDESNDLKERLSSLPKIRWTDFAKSLNVKSRTVLTQKQLIKAINDSESIEGPFLIEMITSYDGNTPYPDSLFSSSQFDSADIGCLK